MKKIKIVVLVLLIIILNGCFTTNNNVKSQDNAVNTNNVDYEKILLNSTVNIYTDSDNYGAGFVYDNNYIITNYHVVDNSEDIKVVTYSRNEYNASLVGFNYDSDIAVLKIDTQLESITFGDSDKIKVGDIITAIGNPNGDLSFSLAKGKVLKVDQELLNKIDKERKFIWYDGNAVSGYSGGPVYDKDGKIIGVLNAKYVGDLSEYDFDNLCKIIPINMIKVIISDIIASN